ncbi:uncharacterized protein BDCG_02547 [Blastomyces dermatitidis ER-3]|uniref:Uncharacterized protein n=4 Tax=Blastomyces TaxID=229219 RepID=A0A179USM4_BLAGS|nr:uncharacterized protein BDBG_05705 [Blastomyces gilchristii SLH14081]XP_045280084.1 uncharacterized protein BDCG_02547 [Blastomyces dermatitidis ER-3]EQL38286.1 hypothetical protein BDFG_00650 [Blastomyces dermatitidis ATCC 26199]OAT00357.1 hypothetical protein BDCG_02547 [Blastomyces dermatitidis ER-3]OAT10021.1 hypothetical protein BDBG_05705 [Blastomyces gilchristii SLH14081]
MAPSTLERWASEESDNIIERLLSLSSTPTSSAFVSTGSTFRNAGYNASSRRSSMIVENNEDTDSESSSSSMSAPSTAPTLSRPSSSAASDSFSESIDTNNAGKLPARYALEEDADGNLTTPPEANGAGIGHYCFFHILDCDKSFTNLDLWKTHVLSHFRLHPAPTTAQCPACPYRISDPHHGIAWRRMLTHLADQHLKQGYSIQNICPDFETMRHLYCANIITRGQLRLLQLPAAPGRPGYSPSLDSVRVGIGSSDDPCVVYMNRHRERRMRERSRKISVA